MVLQPMSPGMRSPDFIPVPAKIQWSGLVQIQSPPPFTGSTFRAPIRNPSSGPCSGNGPWVLARSIAIGRSPPYGPPRYMIRFGRPSNPARSGVTQQTLLPERNIRLTPSSRIFETLRNWRMSSTRHDPR